MEKPIKPKTRLIDLRGKMFHNLTVKNRASGNRNGSSTWLCTCVCGNEVVFSSDHLTRKKNPVKSCGCLRFKSGSTHKQWQGVGEISGSFWIHHVLRNANGSKGRKILEMNLTKEYIWELFLTQNRKCALSGLDITLPKNGSSKIYTASLDRINSSLGYVIGNVQWVHKDVNMMKRAYDQEHFITLCKLIAQNFN